ncbi:hypothetical protein GCM10010174_48830 [Kutzneria viridogrisea]
MSDDTGPDQSAPDLGTCTIGQFEHHVASRASRPGLERVWVVAQAHPYHSEQSRQARRRWPRLSLTANARLPSDDPEERARQWCHNFALRTWIIEHLGSGDVPDWAPRDPRHRHPGSALPRPRSGRCAVHGLA